MIILPPFPLQIPPCLNTLLSTSCQLVLHICARMWGHPLEHRQLASGHLLKKNDLPSLSYCSLPMTPPGRAWRSSTTSTLKCLSLKSCTAAHSVGNKRWALSPKWDTCINHTTTQEQGTSQKRRWENRESQRLGKSVIKRCLPNMAGYSNRAHNICGYRRDQHRKLFFLSFSGIGTPIF